MRDLARRRLITGGALLAAGLLLGGGLLLAGLLNPVVVADPIPVGSEAIVTAEEAGEVFAIFSSDPAGLAEGCRVTTASGRAITLVRSPSTEQVDVRGTLLHVRSRFTAPDAVRMLVVCPNPAGTFVGPADPLGRNTTAVVLAVGVGGGLVIAGLVVAAMAARR